MSMARRGLILAALAAGGVIAPACSSPPASVMVAVTSEAPVPDTVAKIAIQVTRGGEVQQIQIYPNPGTVDGSGAFLPGTIAVDFDPNGGGKISDPIQIDVFAYPNRNAPASIKDLPKVAADTGDGGAILLRTSVTKFVENKQKVLFVPLRFSCLGVKCDEGQTCRAGGCAPNDMPVDQAPDYDDSLVFGNKNPNCFDFDTCAKKPGGSSIDLSGPQLVSRFDPTTCKLRAWDDLVDKANPATLPKLNVGLTWNLDDKDESTVVDLDPVEGWTFDREKPGYVTLSPGLCTAVKAGKVNKGRRVTGCEAKLPTVPLCSAKSPLRAPRRARWHVPITRSPRTSYHRPR